MKKLSKSFYLETDVQALARHLIGKRLCTSINGKLTTGIITETEAYAGVTDRASHAYGGRRTTRTEIMYREGGIAYVYLCYGMHALFNVVTNRKNIPHAILIRSIEPDRGISTMLKRRKMTESSPTLTCGPGRLSQALGIGTKHTGVSLLGKRLWIDDTTRKPETASSTRIGVDYAGPDARKRWRYIMQNTPWITYPHKK